MSDKKTKYIRTEKQELFAVTFVLNGGNATGAYQEVYDVGEDTLITTVYTEAHKLLHNPKVAQRIHELQMQEYSSHILNIEERKQLLTKWAKKGDGKAIDMLNRMEGLYVEKKQVEHSGQVNRTIIVNPTKKPSE